VSSRWSNQPDRLRGNPRRWILVGAWIVFCLTLVGNSRFAAADKRSATVTVSVRVVESCRIDAGSVSTNDTFDLKMRCSPSARPNVRFEPAPQSTGAISMAPSADGVRTLRIDF
jgi:hypothetical protein